MSETTHDDDWMTPLARGLQAPRSQATPPAGRSMIVLNLNESPIAPSPSAIAAAAATIAGVNRYPPTDGGTLIAALAAHTGIDPERIGLAVGSDMLLHVLCMTALAPGRSAVMPRPSFPRYALSTRIAGARAIPVDLAPDGANDPEALLGAIAPDTSILFACTPNGNTGGAMPPGAVRMLARRVPAHVMLVVDEAYAEFDPHADTLAALADRRGPWAVTRTFSKAYALAGLRVGYVLCSDRRIVEVMRAARPIFEITSPALAAAEAALADTAHLQHMLRTIRAGCAQLVDGLRALGFTPLPSVANFVTTDLRRPVAPLVRAMEAHGVLVRGLADAGFEHFMRITVGSAEENAGALAALAAALQPATAA